MDYEKEIDRLKQALMNESRDAAKLRKLNKELSEHINKLSRGGDIMNSTDSEHLINYFRNKEGKYLKLNNGEKVKLSVVGNQQYSLTLTFTYGNKVLVVYFTGLYCDYVTMHIKDGLEVGRYMSPIVKFDGCSTKSIGYALENVLTNWTERKDDVIELNWED